MTKVPPCLCCDEITRGVGQPMVKSATAVNPILLILLSNKIEAIESATDDFSLFEISKTVKLSCADKLAQVAESARRVLQHNVISIAEGSFVDPEFQVNFLDSFLKSGSHVCGNCNIV